MGEDCEGLQLRSSEEVLHASCVARTGGQGGTFGMASEDDGDEQGVYQGDGEAGYNGSCSGF